MTKLTGKQELFCQEYLVDMDSKAAAYRAGYKGKQVSVTASKNLSKQKVIARIAELQADRLKRINFDADEMLRMLYADATADLADIYTETGALKPIHQWPIEWRRGLVAGVETQQDYAYEGGQKLPDGVTEKVRLADRTKIKELLGKHVNVQAFRDKVDNAHTFPDGPQVIRIVAADD